MVGENFMNAIIDLTCKESVSLIRGKHHIDVNDRLYLGYGFQTYLFFSLPSEILFKEDVRARLILYKIPSTVVPISSFPPENHYWICPLLDFFSIYSNWYTPPRTDDLLRVHYEDQKKCSYTEIDLTAIVKAWIKNEPENKGLLLVGDPHARYLTYASARYSVPGMRPVLRLTYEAVSQPLSTTKCSIAVVKK